MNGELRLNRELKMNLGKSITFYPTFSGSLGGTVKQKASLEFLTQYGFWYPFFFYEWTVSIIFSNESR